MNRTKTNVLLISIITFIGCAVGIYLSKEKIKEEQLIREAKRKAAESDRLRRVKALSTRKYIRIK